MRNWKYLIISFVVLIMLVMTGCLEGSRMKIYAASQGINVQYHTQAEICDYIKSNGATLKDDLSFDKNPVLEIPYDAGKLSDTTQQSALNMLKQIRYIAGISDQIQLSDVYGQYAQAASIVNYLNVNLSHCPQQP